MVSLSPITTVGITGSVVDEPREEIGQDTCGRAPHRLVGQLEEVHRHVAPEARPSAPRGRAWRRAAPRAAPRAPARPRPGSGTSVGPAGEEADERRDREARRGGRDAVEPGDDLDRARLEPDLLVRLAQRRGPQVGVDRGLELAARERDLALVRRHRLGPLDEQRRASRRRPRPAARAPRRRRCRARARPASAPGGERSSRRRTSSSVSRRSAGVEPGPRRRSADAERAGRGIRCCPPRARSLPRSVPIGA